MPCHVHCLLHDQPVVPFMKHYNVHILVCLLPQNISQVKQEGVQKH